MSRAAIGIPAIGVAAPLGIGKVEVARRLFAGDRSGLVSRISLLPDRDTFVGAVPVEPAPLPPGFAELDSRNNRLMRLAIDEIAVVVEQVARRIGRDRIAVILGTSTAGIAEGEAAYADYRRHGAWPAGFDYRQQELGSLSQFVARYLDLSGPSYTIATACSSSAKVFASARRLIESGICDAAIVGGVDTLCRMTVRGFAALEAISAGRCNPFGADRDGINVGEAAAAFLLTREPTSVSLLGVGETADAHHISAPDPEGRGAAAAMREALADAEIAPAELGYINLHGTGTPLNDLAEGRAVHEIFGSRTPCSSTKGMMGHALGAAGACEAAFLWLTANPEFNPSNLLPPHAWNGVADPEIPPLNLVRPGQSLSGTSDGKALLSNSLAFGGNNVALVLGEPR